MPEGADAAGIEVDSLSSVIPTTECHVAVADLDLPRLGGPVAVRPTGDLEYARRSDRWQTFRGVNLKESYTCLPSERWAVGELEGGWFPHPVSKNECG